MAWTEHTSSSGRPFFYNPATGASVWERPAGISEARVFSRDTPPTLRACMAARSRADLLVRGSVAEGGTSLARRSVGGLSRVFAKMSSRSSAEARDVSAGEASSAQRQV